jgi:anti-anti-sigma regulatory factor
MEPAVEVKVFGDSLLISWHGNIAFGKEPHALGEKICEEYPGFKQVIVNLADVELRPADVPELLVQYLSAYAAGYHIRLCSPSPRVREVLESTRVIEVFQLPVDQSKEESLAAFRYAYPIPEARSFSGVVR